MGPKTKVNSTKRNCSANGDLASKENLNENHAGGQAFVILTKNLFISELQYIIYHIIQQMIVEINYN